MDNGTQGEHGGIPPRHPLSALSFGAILTFVGGRARRGARVGGRSATPEAEQEPVVADRTGIFSLLTAEGVSQVGNMMTFVAGPHRDPALRPSRPRFRGTWSRHWRRSPGCGGARWVRDWWRWGWVARCWPGPGTGSPCSHRLGRPDMTGQEVSVPPSARDAMLALLAGAAGCIDALSYLRLGNVFTANMTGNAVLLGIAAGQQAAARALHSVAALAGFVLGVLAGAALCGRHKRSEAGRWPPRVTLALAVELVALLALAAGWALAGEDPVGSAEYGLIGASALAMGVQSAAVQQLGVSGVATTYVTGTLTGLVADLALPGASRGSLLRRGGVLLALVAGAAAGAAVVGVAGGVAALIPVVLVAAVVAVAAWPRRPRGRSVSEQREPSGLRDEGSSL
jgi:uncharacterized membrane protein YoaK (UPF0700 family)